MLADFDAGAARVFGMHPRAFERRLGLKRFWARLASAPDFFNTLDPLPDAMELFDAVRPKNPSSSPVSHEVLGPSCRSGAGPSGTSPAWR